MTGKYGLWTGTPAWGERTTRPVRDWAMQAFRCKSLAITQTVSADRSICFNMPGGEWSRAKFHALT